MGGLPLEMMGRCPEPHMSGGKAPVDALVVGASSLVIIPLPVGLPIWEPLVGNWPRVKHLLEGWDLPQNWGRVRHRKLQN